MFWVMTAFSLPAASHSASFLWAGVGLCVRGQHLRPVEAEKFFGVAFIERMA